MIFGCKETENSKLNISKYQVSGLDNSHLGEVSSPQGLSGGTSILRPFKSSYKNQKNSTLCNFPLAVGGLFFLFLPKKSPKEIPQVVIILLIGQASTRTSGGYGVGIVGQEVVAFSVKEADPKATAGV